MDTTIPYKIKSAQEIGRLAFGGEMPVFEGLPTKEDYEIAVKATGWPQPNSTRVVISFGLFMVVVSKDKRQDDKFYLSHAFSIKEQWSSFAMQPYEGMTWETLVTVLKAQLQTQVEELEATVRKMKRAIATPTTV